MNNYFFHLFILIVIGGFMSMIVFSENDNNGNDSNYNHIWKDNNMTIAFKENNIPIGQAKLKSHKFYDEILEIPSGKNRTVIWYEFSGFNDVQLGALKGVEFIDMKKEIVNESLLKEGEFINKSKIMITNPKYLSPINKTYRFVYLKYKKWLPYNSLDISEKNIIIGVQTDLLWGEFIDVRLIILDSKLDRHALVSGTNSGFVITAPKANPLGDNLLGYVDGSSLIIRDTSPATAAKITEIGWWCDDDADDTNFEVGLYDNDGANGIAGTRLYVDNTNSKGTIAGWKTVSVDWEITPSTTYWIAVQIDTLGGEFTTDAKSSDGLGYDEIESETTLLNPFGGGTIADSNGMLAIYALWKIAEEESKNSTFSLNSNSGWKFAGGTLKILQ